MTTHRASLIGGLALLVLAGALQATLDRMVSRLPASVHIRWAVSVDARTQERIELEHGLLRQESRAPDTWTYYLNDISRSNIRSLIQNPAVADTQNLNREAFDLAEDAPRAPFPNRPAQRRADLLGFGARAAAFFGVGTLVLWAWRIIRNRHKTIRVSPDGTQATETVTAFGRQYDVVLLLILAAALAVRVFLATTAPYIHDEENTAIPLAKSISFAPGQMYLPLRGENHGALPAYLVHASSALFGTTPLAYRAVHVLLGMITILIVYSLTNQLFGTRAARWSATLLAFNEYFLSFSSRATANTPYLFLMTAAVYLFSRFLATERVRYLYGAAVPLSLAFYCKEHAVLLLPVFLLAMLGASHRRWLRGPHAYGACLVFVLAIAPDVLWNVRTNPDTAHVTYSGGYLGQATYAAHLRRVGGIGLSPYPAMFYAHRPVNEIYRVVTGETLRNVTPEYHPVNPAIGLLLAWSVVMATGRGARSDPRHRLLLLLAWGVFGFFTLIRAGDAPFRLTAASWVWVEVTLVPAVVFAGSWLAGIDRRWRTAVWVLTAVALFFAIDSLAWTAAE